MKLNLITNSYEKNTINDLADTPLTTYALCKWAPNPSEILLIDYRGGRYKKQPLNIVFLDGVPYASRQKSSKLFYIFFNLFNEVVFTMKIYGG